MNRPRLIAGYLCVLLGFAVIVMIGYGVIDPIGMAQPASSIGALFAGLLPSVLLALVVFLLGLWLVKGARKP